MPPLYSGLKRKLAGVQLSEMVFELYHITWCHIPEGNPLHIHCCEDLVSHIVACCFNPVSLYPL
jgi:hypothetical protein